MKRERRAAIAVLVVSTLCLTTTAVRGADLATKKLARSLLKQHASALVTVEAVLSIRVKVIEAPPGVGGQIEAQSPESQQSISASGILIDKSGLVAVPLLMLNPTLAAKKIPSIETPMGTIRLGMEGSFSTVKVIMGDSTELEASVALVDETAGIALVQVSPLPETNLVALSGGKEDVTLDSFESLLLLNRMSGDFGRQPTCQTGRFIQTLAEPNSVLDVTTSTPGAGSAVFDSAGRFVGIGVLLSSETESSMDSVILPTSRVAALAARVLDNHK